MRLKRKRSLQVIVGDVTEHNIPHLKAKAGAIRGTINRGLRAFRLSADITKVHIDKIYEKLVDKAKTLTEKAKDDIDKLAKSEEFKLEATVAGKLLEVDNRLSQLKQHGGRDTKQHHHEHRVSTLFSELQDMCDIVNSKQIEFKLHDKAKDYLECVSCLGKPRTHHRKSKMTEKLVTNLQSDSHHLSQNLTLSFTSLCDDLSSLSTSNNVSLTSINSINEDLELSICPSNASSSFCLVNFYGPAWQNLPALAYPTQRNVDQVSVDSTLDDLESVDEMDMFGDGHECDLKRFGENNQNTLTFPLFDQNYEEFRALEETSWSSSLALSAESSSENVNESTSNVFKEVYRNMAGCNSTVLKPCLSLTCETDFQTCVHRGACVIPDIAILPDHVIALSDFYHNNVQFYSKDYQLISEEKCPYPMGICVVHDNTVAVSLRRSSVIALFQIDATGISRINEISVRCSAYTWNVIYKAGNLYVVCDKNHVHVLTLDGTETSLIKSGVPVEKGYIRYFDVSDDGNLLYLCEGLGLRLSCIDKHGNHIWSFDSSDVPLMFSGADNHVVEDVCFTKGRLLATNWMQSKVFEISLDGKYVRDIVTTHLESPRAMSVAGDKLVVTQFNPNIENSRKRTVKVFKIGLT